MKPLRKEMHIRLYVTADLTQGLPVMLDKEQAHYLGSVMRVKLAEHITLFNGRDGEWAARIDELEKSRGTATPTERLREQAEEPDIWFLFAPLKSQKNERLVEQATELGASRILPVLMRHGIVDKIHCTRWQHHAVGAAEQCERFSVPAVEEMQKLDSILSGWPKDRILVMADESGAGAPLYEAEAALGTKLAIITGPEGGFSLEEMKKLRALPFVRPVSLGPRILKADTAAIGLLAALQAACGDWRSGKPAFRNTD